MGNTVNIHIKNAKIFLIYSDSLKLYIILVVFFNKFIINTKNSRNIEKIHIINA